MLVTDRKDLDQTVDSTGQHKDHIILSDSERDQGFVRPVRNSYRHVECGGNTLIPTLIAETFASKPSFYTRTFCAACMGYYPVDKFVWTVDSTVVGS